MEKNIYTIHLNKFAFVDFDKIVEDLKNLTLKGKVLITDRSYKYISCFLIAYMMMFKKIGVQFASMQVFNILKNVEADHILYN